MLLTISKSYFSNKFNNWNRKNIPNKIYDFVLINIDRNTIIKEFKYFLKVINISSIIILSGFLNTDVDYISKFLNKEGLKIINSEIQNNWALLIVKFI